MAGRLPYGPRDELITAAVAAALDALRAGGSTIERRELDEAEAASCLTDHLRRVLRRHLDAVPRSARPTMSSLPSLTGGRGAGVAAR